MSPSWNRYYLHLRPYCVNPDHPTLLAVEGQTFRRVICWIYMPKANRYRYTSLLGCDKRTLLLATDVLLGRTLFECTASCPTWKGHLPNLQQRLDGRNVSIDDMCSFSFFFSSIGAQKSRCSFPFCYSSEFDSSIGAQKSSVFVVRAHCQSNATLPISRTPSSRGAGVGLDSTMESSNGWIVKPTSLRSFGYDWVEPM